MPIFNNIDQAMRYVDNQVKFATAVALTRAAKQVQQKEKQEIKNVYDRPKPYTQNAIYIVPANKNQQEIHSIVGIKDKAKRGNAPAKYLRATIFSGRRRMKGFEKRLKTAGLMPSGYYAVPSKAVRVNKFGNMTLGQIKKAMTANQAGSKFFSGRAGKRGTLAIWQRYGAKQRKIKPFIVFVRGADYDRQFNFYMVASKTAKDVIDREFSSAFKRALN